MLAPAIAEQAPLEHVRTVPRTLPVGGATIRVRSSVRLTPAALAVTCRV